MIIGLLQIDVQINAHSLKEKRYVLKGFKDRLKNKFNVAVSETDYTDKWQRAELSMVSVSASKQKVETVLRNVLKYADENPEWTVSRFHLDYY